MAVDERGATVTGALLERDGELERIDDLLAGACQGRGAAVLIEGQAGIGKTSLVEAARRRAQDLGMSVLHGRGTELERDYALGAVRQCLQPAVQSAHSTRTRRARGSPTERASDCVVMLH